MNRLETNPTSGRHGRNTVCTPADERFMWAICCSMSKSTGVAQALDDEVGTGVGGGLDGEPGELLDVDGRPVGEAGAGEFDALVGCEQSGRLLVVVEHADHDVAEQLHRLVDDVDVAEVERIETAGDQHR